MSLRSTLLRPLCLFVTFVAGIAGMPSHAETFRNPRRIPLPVDPYGVTTGDLNGDGRNDIVWTELPAYPGIPMLHVLLAGANGQYAPAPDLSLPFIPSVLSCIVEDVTGDKRNDLVCLGLSNNNVDAYLLTYVGNGDGTFAAPVETADASYITYSEPILARAGDLNADGFSDVVVMQANYSFTLPFLSDGHGGFKSAPSFNGSFNYSIPTVTDLNGDGKLDILWPTGPRVNLGNGDGTFSAPVPYDPGVDSNCAFGDVDGDGHLDAACTWYDGGAFVGEIHLSVLHGNPDGSFASAPLFTRLFGDAPTDKDGLSSILIPVLVADLNGDGYADIVSLSGDGYCVLLGGPNTTWSGPPEQFISASVRSEGGLGGIYGVSIADMNGDGLPDIVAVGPNGLYITYAQRDGTLSSAPAPEVGKVSTSVTLVDVNGDGNLDVVSAGDTALKLSLGRGDGTFEAPQAITSTGNFDNALYADGVVVSGDFNGDGKQDLLAKGNVAVYTTQNYILFGHGDGTFSPPQPVSIALGQVADLNGDGLSDIYSIVNSAISTNVLTVSLSKGDGTFTSVPTQLPVDQPNDFTDPSVGPALADFRHTGRLDAAVASGNNAYLLRGHGDGAFDSRGTTLALPGLPNLNSLGAVGIASGDFDADGNADIAVLVQYGSGFDNYTTPTSGVWVFYGNGDGTFSGPVLAGTFNRDAQAMSAGDLNGDGLADLVLTSYDVYQDNGVLIVHALPGRAWGPEVDYTGGDGLSPFWITDINHDGRNDLIFSEAFRGNYEANAISVLLNLPATDVTGTVAANPEPSLITQPFTLKANLVPPDASSSLTGAVSFSVDGTSVGSAPLSGNTATLVVPGTVATAGVHSIAASWPGDGTLPGLALSGTHTVSLFPVKLSVTSSANPSAVGQNVTFSVQVQAAPPRGINAPKTGFPGTLTLYDGTNLLGTIGNPSGSYSFVDPVLAGGPHTITASYSGDSVFAAGTVGYLQTVGTLPIAMQLSASPGSPAAGAATSLTALVTLTTSACPSCPYTAQVQFSDSGKPLGSSPVDLNGLATLPTSFTVGGPHTLSASYPGDNDHQSASATLNLQVSPGNTSITLAASANLVSAGTPVSFTAHIVPASGSPSLAGAAIAFSFGGQVFATVPVDSVGTATTSYATLPAGNDKVTATLGQTASLSGSSASTAVTVTRAQTVLVLSGSPTTLYQRSVVTLTAALTTPAPFLATGTVQLMDGSAALAAPRIANNAAIFRIDSLAPGDHELTATYPGDANNLPAVSAPPVKITVLLSSFAVSSTPAAISVQTEHHLTASVSAKSLGNFADRLLLSTALLPAHMTVQFDSPGTIDLAAGGTGAISVYLDTDDVLGYARATPIKKPGRHTPGPLWAFLPAPLLLLLLRRRRRGNLALAGVGAVLLAGLLIPLSGCSGMYPKSTAPGVYTIQIHAVGAQTGVAQTIDLQVTVSP